MKSSQVLDGHFQDLRLLQLAGALQRVKIRETSFSKRFLDGMRTYLRSRAEQEKKGKARFFPCVHEAAIPYHEHHDHIT